MFNILKDVNDNIQPLNEMALANIIDMVEYKVDKIVQMGYTKPEQVWSALYNSSRPYATELMNVLIQMYHIKTPADLTNLVNQHFNGDFRELIKELKTKIPTDADPFARETGRTPSSLNVGNQK